MLTLATFNLLNLHADTPPERLMQLATIITNALRGPDILAVQEIGAFAANREGRVPATAAYQALIDAVRHAGGPCYAFREIPPVLNQDGGLHGMNIRNGLLFNPDRVQFVDRGMAGPDDATGIGLMQDQLALTLNPGRIDPQHPAFAGDKQRHWAPSRKALAAEFEVAGKRLFFVVCHLKSMRGSNRREQDYTKKQRHVQAAVIHDFAAALLARDPQALLVVLGDMNDGTGSKTLDTLKGHALQNLVEQVPKRQRYTHRQGNRVQALDHVLISRALAGSATIRIPHSNDSAAAQASDHDPVWVELAL